MSAEFLDLKPEENVSPELKSAREQRLAAVGAFLKRWAPNPPYTNFVKMVALVRDEDEEKYAFIVSVPRAAHVLLVPWLPKQTPEGEPIHYIPATDMKSQVV